MNKSGQVFLISLAAAVKINESQHDMLQRPGFRRSHSVGAIPDDSDFNDRYAGQRAQRSDERALEGYLTKVLPLRGSGLENQSSHSLRTVKSM